MPSACSGRPQSAHHSLRAARCPDLEPAGLPGVQQPPMPTSAAPAAIRQVTRIWKLVRSGALAAGILLQKNPSGSKPVRAQVREPRWDSPLWEGAAHSPCSPPHDPAACFSSPAFHKQSSYPQCLAGEGCVTGRARESAPQPPCPQSWRGWCMECLKPLITGVICSHTVQSIQPSHSSQVHH